MHPTAPRKPTKALVRVAAAGRWFATTIVVLTSAALWWERDPRLALLGLWGLLMIYGLVRAGIRGERRNAWKRWRRAACAAGDPPDTYAHSQLRSAR